MPKVSSETHPEHSKGFIFRRKTVPEHSEGFIAFVLVIIFLLIIGIAAFGFFIFKNSKNISSSPLGQKKATGNFVKANNSVQNVQEKPQSSGSFPEMSRGSSSQVQEKQPSPSAEVVAPASPKSVVTTPAPMQIPQTGNDSPTTFN